jgi:phage gp29-like protein
MKPRTSDLTAELARPAQAGLRSVWQWRPLASMTPAMVADVLRRAATGDAHDFLLAADDIKEKDLHYRAVLQTRTLAVAGLPWDVQPADDSPQAKRAAELVAQVLDDLDLFSLASHLMDAVAKGYAVAEILWETGSVWRPEQIIPREAHWFTFDRDTGSLLHLVDGSAEGQTLPLYKFLFHKPPLMSGIALQGGLARSALWAWVFKSYALRDWARFCELFGQPIRVGKYHQGAAPEDIAVLKQAAFQLGSDAAAVIPQEMVLDLVESGSKSASADLYYQLIDYLDRQVSKAVLGQTMTTDDGSSQAQAKVHNEVRADIMRADARSLAETIRRDLVAPLVRLNLGDAAPLPRFAFIVEEPEDTAALADQVQKLAASGVVIPQAWVRERFAIPEPAEGEAVIGEPLESPVANPPESPGSPVPNRRAVHALQATKNTPEDDAIDVPGMQADRMETEAEPAWSAIMERVRQIVEQAQSLPELRDALLAAYGDLPTDELARVMELGFAAAELAGRYLAHVESEVSDGRG